jgi:hypothetical protein
MKPSEAGPLALERQSGVDRHTLDIDPPCGAPSPADPLAGPLNLIARRRAIHSILDARFSVEAFEAVQRENAAYWASPSNDMARGIYGEAMREKQALSAASDECLEAELLDIANRAPRG